MALRPVPPRPMRLLDLFCGAGGAAMGYHRAGFTEIVGVDIKPQPRYPFIFVQGDALDYLREHGHEFDAIHASPPCQAYTQLAKGEHPRLIEPVRDELRRVGVPYVIENVVGAPLRAAVILCGSMFGLKVQRHRLFETMFALLSADCVHGGEIRAYYGKKGWLVWTPGAANVQKRGRRPLLRGSVDLAPADMGIDWMTTWDELREAIPPAYTEFIGRQLLTILQRSEAGP